MRQSEVEGLMDVIFREEIMSLREAGQEEYAHDEGNAFANFERIADDLPEGVDRKWVLWTYAMKHRDGIVSYLQGHRSQRESVRGRINDLIVYLFLLRAMIEEEESPLGATPVDDDDDDDDDDGDDSPWAYMGDEDVDMEGVESKTY